MQQRRQNSVGKQGFAAAAGQVRAEPLAISSCTLAIIGRISGLLNAGPCSLEGEESWVGETFVSQVKLHLCSEGLGVRFVSDKHIRYKTENALLLFRLELLGSNLLRGITHSNCPLHSQNAEFDIG